MRTPTQALGSLGTALLKGTIGSGAVKAGNAVLGFGVAVALARALGSAGYGVYTTAFVIISFASIFVQFGLPKLAVRETAAADARGDWGAIKATWLWASRTAILLSVVLMSCAVAVSYLVRDLYSPDQIQTFRLALLLVPLFALGALRAAALQGLRFVARSQFPDSIVRPGLLLIFALLLGTLLPASPQAAMMAHVISAGIAFLVGAAFLWLVTPSREQPRLRLSSLDKTGWISSAASLALVGSMVQINSYADILVLSLFRSSVEIGLYRVAYQSTTLVSFGTSVVAIVVAPRFARLFATGQRERLQHLATKSAQGALLLALPATLFFVFLGRPALQFVFGQGTPSLIRFWSFCA